MAVEIEWKLLVTRMPDLGDVPGTRIVQGYLDADARPTVRVRLKGGKATLNLKSRIEERTAEGSPQTCHEFEYEIPRGDGERLLELARCTIAKTRYVMPEGLELDVFEGRHAGLVMAEMEVAEGTPCPQPPPGWEWRDVSHDPRYSNRWMAEHGIPPA